MTSKDIADALAEARGISKAEARGQVAAVLEAISAGIAKGDVALAGFGKFSVARRPARAGRNPRTGEALFIAASKRIQFKPSKALKNRVVG
ncbi:HU family DNA-binding protein [Novosphingobium album (ex Liu et al. 2023)]|uniref:HU family DNA-binding protein n=1 Tax=Novosphingobium album (ex Liu et al. 2023) TaxID=3031130 RepID=A0ABT5WT25_9SPHN|nr:HU family DNA-binding protein [Novosphingobium album (ex Liu et al. 2023)]MDE8652168.1 HU family DNA-binding protein [Novosphingobium album (ex Liu et al. 2023)]